MKFIAKTDDLRPVCSFLAGQDSMGLIRLNTVGSNGIIGTVDRHDARWSIKCPAEIQAPGDTFLSMNRFHSFVSRSPAPTCRLEKSDRHVSFASSDLQGEIATTSAPFFPVARAFSPDKTRRSVVSGASFLKAVKAAMAGVNKTKKGDLWSFSFFIAMEVNYGFIMSCDRAHLCSFIFECDGHPMQFGVSAHDFQALLQWPEEAYKIEADESNVHVESERFSADFSQMAQNMPNIRPGLIRRFQEAKDHIELPKEQLLYALDAASAIDGRRANFYAYFDGKADGAWLRANGERIDELVIDLHGKSSKDVRIYFDHRRLNDALAHFDRMGLLKDPISLIIGDEKSPIGILFEETNCEAFYALMPLAPPKLENK